MQWWGWLLIAVGLIVVGAIKIAIFKKIKQKNAAKGRFTDED